MLTSAGPLASRPGWVMARKRTRVGSQSPFRATRSCSPTRDDPRAALRPSWPVRLSCRHAGDADDRHTAPGFLSRRSALSATTYRVEHHRSLRRCSGLSRVSVAHHRQRHSMPYWPACDPSRTCRRAAPRDFYERREPPPKIFEVVLPLGQYNGRPFRLERF
jgi:hypothetical protein